MKRAPRQIKLMSNIEVSAFAAILVVLLALFAGRSVWDRHDLRTTAVDLVKVKHTVSLPYASREDAMIIAIQRDGGIWFGTNRSDLEHLPHEIQDSLAHGTEHRVYLSVDKYAKYQTVEQVIDAIHSTGIEQVTFFADEASQQK